MMETKKTICDGMESKLADLLLDPESASPKMVEHVAECDGCRGELEGLCATMTLMDAWEGPEPSPYFMTKFGARLREEQQAAPAGWFERLRARFTYGPQPHVRPLAAMTLAIAMLLGGGAYVGLNNLDQPVAPSPEAAVVHDLQLLDSNAQLLDQLETLSDNQNNGD
jgi:hypothetical protein